MPEPPVVADSGPLIALALIGRLDLLRDLYETVLVPEAVWREVAGTSRLRPGAAEIAESTWLVRTTLAHSPDPLLRAELGPGEAEAIALATERRGRLLLDERKARRIAEVVYGLPVRGTIGTITPLFIGPSRRRKVSTRIPIGRAWATRRSGQRFRKRHQGRGYGP